MEISASDVLEDEVINGYEELVRLLGKTVKYSRFKDKTGDPQSGYSKTWYEQNLTFEAAIGRVSSYIASQDSLLHQSDRKLIFKQSEFTSQSDAESALSSDASSGQKDVEVSDGSKFSAGENVLLVERSGDEVSEEAEIDSISSNTLTMTSDLSYTYETVDNAYVEANEDEAVPRPGDEVVIDGETWTTEIEDDVIWNEDGTGNLFKVFIRKKT